MKVGDERIDPAKDARRVDEYVGLGEVAVWSSVATWFSRKSSMARTLVVPTAIRLPAYRKRVLNSGGELVPRDGWRAPRRVGGDGAEGAQADVQREIGGLHALCGECGEKFGREMQSRGRRGHGDLTRAIGINGLVALEVRRPFLGCAAALDVWRQGDVAEAVGDIRDGLAGGRAKPDERAAAALLFENLSLKIPVRMREGCAHRQFFGWTHEAPLLRAVCPEFIRGELACPEWVESIEWIERACSELGPQQQALDRTAARAEGMQPRGQDGRGVAKQRVAGAQKFRQVGKNVMRDGVRGCGRPPAGATGRGRPPAFAR